MVNLENLSITSVKATHQLALPFIGLAPEVVEPLHTANQPARLGSRHTRIRHHLTEHEYQTLRLRKVEVVGDSSVRLGVGAVQLVRRKRGEDDSRCVGVRKLSRCRGLRRRRSRRVEAPLEEVNVCASLGGGLSLAGFLSLLILDWFFLFDIVAGQRKDELWVLAGCGGDALVCFNWDNCADGAGVRDMTESPDTFNFLGRETEELLNVDEGVEGLDAAGLGFLGLGSGLLRARRRRDCRRRGRGGRGRRGVGLWGCYCGSFAPEVFDLVLVGVFQRIDVFMALPKFRLVQLC